DVPRLLELIGQLLKIEWSYEPGPVQTIETEASTWSANDDPAPPVQYVDELIDLGQIGYVTAIHLKLDQIDKDHPEHAAFVSQMRSLVERFDLGQYMATLQNVQRHDH
ncbi:MAG: hypothetical protein ACRCTX_05640, partial [Afipia sp.]